MHAYRRQVHLRESVLLWAWELNLSELAAMPLSLKLSLQCTGLEGLISVVFACFLFYVYECFASFTCIYTCALHICLALEARRGFGSLETRVMESCKLPYG